MAKHYYIEKFDGESWQSITSMFMQYCIDHKDLKKGGFSEGDYTVITPDGINLISVAIPDHSLQILDYLKEWCELHNRKNGYREHGRIWLSNQSSVILRDSKIINV